MSSLKLHSIQKMAAVSSVILLVTVLSVSCYSAAGNKAKTIEMYSKRWKSYKKVEDFLWLKDHALPIGASQSYVKRVFGEPLSIGKREDGSEFWPYSKINVPKKQYYTCAITFNSKKKVSGTHTKGIM